MTKSNPKPPPDKPELVAMLVAGLAFVVMAIHELATGQFIIRKAGLYLYGREAILPSVLELLAGIAILVASCLGWRKRTAAKSNRTDQ